MSALSQARRASRQDKARRRWPQNASAPAGKTSGKLGMEVRHAEMNEVCRRDRPLQGPKA
jgi:hypothetical protein